MTRIEHVKEILSVEWTTAEGKGEGTATRKMICVLLEVGKKENVGVGEQEENVDVVVDGVAFVTVGISKTPMAFWMRNLWRIWRVEWIRKDKLTNILDTKSMLVYTLYNKCRTDNFLDMSETLDNFLDIRIETLVDHLQDNQNKFKNMWDTKEMLDKDKFNKVRTTYRREFGIQKYLENFK